MTDSILGFDPNKSWDYENGFYLTSHVKRISKLIAHYELYKSITSLPGHILEFGVYKGASLIRFATFRNILESEYSRKIIGFDAFGEFPRQKDELDNEFIKQFESAGGFGIKTEDLDKAMTAKSFNNYELIKGDIHDTLPKFITDFPETRIALLHIDVDVYETSAFILEQLFDRVVRGGLIVFDDYNTVAGETRAVDEFFTGSEVLIQKYPFSHIPCFIKKN